jgi:hypothetical protein
MAASDKERLTKKYGKGKTFRELMDDLISDHQFKTTEAVMDIEEKHFEKVWKRIPKKSKVGRTLVLPDITDLFPDDTVISDFALARSDDYATSLRGAISDSIRSAMGNFTANTGEQNFIRPAGRTAGQINPKLMESFRAEIDKRMNGFLKVDPKTGRPPNIDSIVTTQMRTTINGIKEEYKDNMLSLNPDLESTKTWNHNPSLSKEPRRGHAKVGGTTKGHLDLFKVPYYKKVKGRWIIDGYDFMSRPHDPFSEPRQVVNCNCDITYKMRYRKTK